MRLLFRFACNAVALYVAAWALSGVTYGDQWWTLLIAAAVFTLVNMWIKPVLTILSLPFIIVTLGLFLFLLNILMLYITDWLMRHLDLESFRAGPPSAVRRRAQPSGWRGCARAYSATRGPTPPPGRRCSAGCAAPPPPRPSAARARRS